MASEDDAIECPTCGGAMTLVEMLLCRRDDDGSRTCRVAWACGGRHAWSRWADRPDDPLEVSPYPPRLDRR